MPLILPGCEEDNRELVVSLMVAYIFKAMTNLANDIRLKAFEFLDLVLEFYPPSLPLYAEKDKGKLKIALVGLFLCLSLFPWKYGMNEKLICMIRMMLGKGYCMLLRMICLQDPLDFLL
ncbi:hypothetical protein K1719_041651 [Acacia pycnantha]|nr:hypothetical protein K1719_041651 [Acacia pycnantha]